MMVGDCCPSCDGFMQYVNPKPKVGDRLVCASLACDFETVITCDDDMDWQPSADGYM